MTSYAHSALLINTVHGSLVDGSERFAAHPSTTRAATDAATSPDVEGLLERHPNRPARASRVYTRALERDFEESIGLCGGLPIREVISYDKVATHDRGLAVVDAPHASTR